MRIRRVASIPLGLVVGMTLVACAGLSASGSPGSSGQLEVSESPSDLQAPPSAASAPPLAAGDWSLTPLPANAEFVSAARGTCFTEMEVDPRIPLRVQDQRRPDLAALYFEGAASGASFLIRRAEDGTFLCVAGGGGDLPDVRGVDVAITEWSNISDEQSEAWMVIGFVDVRARTVEIHTLDGRIILASVGNGRFVAIYRGPQRVALLLAFDAAGREIGREAEPLALGAGPDEPLPS